MADYSPIRSFIIKLGIAFVYTVFVCVRACVCVCDNTSRVRVAFIWDKLLTRHKS